MTNETKIPNTRWWRILPATVLVYIVANIDRANISFAMAGGMMEDLGLDAVAIGMAIGIFFWGYLLLQVPGGHLAERKSAKHFIAAMIVIWGGCATICGFISTSFEFNVVRFILGIAEGGIFPAILVIISHWFPPAERARANSIFLLSFPLSAIISGPISGWLIATWGWREMFIIEGVASIALIFLWMPLIADRPSKAKWLSAEECNWIESELAAEAAAKKAAAATNKSATKTSYRELVFDINLWKMVAVYFLICCAFYVLSFWLPTIIKDILKADIGMVGWLSALPNIAAALGIVFFGRMADKSQNRRKYCIIPYVCVGLCIIASVFTASYSGWLSFAFLCLCGFFWLSGHPVLWTIVAETFQPEVAGGARGAINALGNLSGFFAPMLLGYMIQNYSRDAGMYIFAVLVFLAAVIVWSMPKNAETKAAVEKTREHVAATTNAHA
ncbi:hypothetical protein CJ260_05245 [Megasphaera sp. ASD88]|uniref:MFS transporter n=1 Tax=Megasphaera sp. ASD88 TaxID=2027407 RepID=UPI000BABD3E6|nr:MFS transporter [Megasphaera sp. ASD88]PAV39169.1 hypothetical protein CJ260_05245 [Megasphaera sp. ASD88]